MRDWLQATSGRSGLAGGSEIIDRYRRFQVDLPAICVALSLERDELTFVDMSTTIADWLRTNR